MSGSECGGGRCDECGSCVDHACDEARSDAPAPLPYSAELIAAAVRRIAGTMREGMEFRLQRNSDRSGRWWAKAGGAEAMGATALGAITALADLLPAPRPRP